MVLLTMVKCFTCASIYRFWLMFISINLVFTGSISSPSIIRQVISCYFSNENHKFFFCLSSIDVEGILLLFCERSPLTHITKKMVSSTFMTCGGLHLFFLGLTNHSKWIVIHCNCILENSFIVLINLLYLFKDSVNNLDFTTFPHHLFADVCQSVCINSSQLGLLF